MTQGAEPVDGQPPAAEAVLAAMTPADRARLSDQVAHARRASRVELDEAVDAVLGAVPRLVRGRVRTLLVGRR